MGLRGGWRGVRRQASHSADQVSLLHGRGVRLGWCRPWPWITSFSRPVARVWRPGVGTPLSVVTVL
nr:MAG TPA: hypothetical protein [Caudoviricetes sp.]